MRGRGFVLNLSEFGLYVQTTFSPPHTKIFLDLFDPDGHAAIRVATLLTRWYLPDARLRSVVKPGLGLRVVSAPSAYVALIASTLVALDPSSAR